MTALLLPFFVLAVLGLMLSLIAHVAALVGLPPPLASATFGLHIGIFVVWLPAVLVSNKLAADFKRKDFWKATLRGCPLWMRWLTYGFFGYAFVNFMRFALVAPPKGGGGMANAPPEALWGFSGHWMAFYSVAAAILYSAIAVSKSDTIHRCLNGHPMSPSTNFCPECGAVVAEQNIAEL